jgi:hypothetical protein
MEREYVKNRVAWTEEEKQHAVLLANKGLTYAEIASKIHRSYNSVRSFMYINKIRRYHVQNKDNDADYEAFIREHRSKRSKDPRSLACQSIKICNGKGCYRAEKCPAHAAFLNKHQSSDELKIAI